MRSGTGVGPGVKEPLAIGAHVVGAGPGAFAEYLVLPSAGVLPVPPGWSDAEALGMVLSWATALAALRPLGGLDAFFDGVMVNAEDKALRENRLALLGDLHALMNRVADLSKLAA